MNEVLKQRLVGALILVALGVVFWPIIFVQPGKQGAEEATRIPPRPSVDTAPVETPGRAGLRPSPELKKEPAAKPVMTLAAEPTPPVEKGESPDAAAQGSAVASAPAEQAVAEKKNRSEPPVKPRLDEDGIPVVWILRVASVSSADRADDLRKQLLGMGHKAYTKKIKSGGKTLYRVYVGPKAEKAQLEKIQPAINAEFGVTTLITRYYP